MAVKRKASVLVGMYVAIVFCLMFVCPAITTYADLTNDGVNMLITSDGVTSSSRLRMYPSAATGNSHTIVTLPPESGEPFTKVYEVDMCNTSYEYTDPNTVFSRIELDQLSFIPESGDWIYISYYVRALKPDEDYIDDPTYGLLIRRQGGNVTTQLVDYGEKISVTAGWQKKTIVTKFTKTMGTKLQLDFAVGNPGKKQCFQFADVRAIYFGAVTGVNDDDKRLQIENFVNDATLKDLKIKELSVEGFSPELYEYDYLLPFDAAEDISVSDIFALPTNPRAEVSIEGSLSIPGTAKITLTPENYDIIADDVSQKRTYTINITKAPTPYLFVKQDEWKFKKDGTEITKLDAEPCNTISAEVSVVNYNEEEHSAVVILCLYKDDELIKIAAQEYTVLPDQNSHNVSAYIDSSDISDWSDVYVKAFLRKGVTNPQPISAGKRISAAGME